ncbi:hypothetical protein GGR28_001886 [Lewinella aquimaris]|uniref:Uncharacterized protein n=1 Tax=Neolewinella aquimaris TaxID=1835722 RepID=A0A840EE99_9BACT|nr:DUF4249 family protein [Neolewinella aquimaris]MBB4079266.1 hypothetical protein [Neolewinella aquimaris]
MRASLIFLLFLLLVGCTEPTEPRFQIEASFYLVEGKIADVEGSSEVNVRRSDFGSLQLEFESVPDADVVAVNGAGARVQWQLVDSVAGKYQPPADFAGRTGEAWFLEVNTADGTSIYSDPETVPPPVALTDFEIVFDQEASYDVGRERFIPAFKLLVDFQDPADRTDYYQWDYAYWEKIDVCASCYGGQVWREGSCREVGSGSRYVQRYDYYCDALGGCYRQTVGNEFQYGQDEFFAGQAVVDRPIGQIEFIDYGGLLVEAVQYTITQEAYAYGKVISDLLTGSSGLNATIPATLDGNVRNADPEGVQVLGYVGTAGVSSMRRFITRSETTGTPLPADRQIRPEPSVGAFIPPRAYCSGDGKTPEKPRGWPE